MYSIRELVLGYILLTGVSMYINSKYRINKIPGD